MIAEIIKEKEELVELRRYIEYEIGVPSDEDTELIIINQFAQLIANQDLLNRTKVSSVFSHALNSLRNCVE